MIKPHWPAPHYLHAYTTVKQDSIASLLPSQIEWLSQTHSTKCVIIETTVDRQADAAITRLPHHALVIKTADCLPIILSSITQQEIAAIHAGWRGLAHGIIEETLAQLTDPLDTYMAWIGPAICGQCYQIGDEVRDIFLSHYPFSSTAISTHDNMLHIDLKKIATFILRRHGITSVFQSPLCTFEEKSLFSYRRDGQTGRIKTFIWMTEL